MFRGHRDDSVKCTLVWDQLVLFRFWNTFTHLVLSGYVVYIWCSLFINHIMLTLQPYNFPKGTLKFHSAFLSSVGCLYAHVFLSKLSFCVCWQNDAPELMFLMWSPAAPHTFSSVLQLIRMPLCRWSGEAEDGIDLQHKLSRTHGWHLWKTVDSCVAVNRRK